MLAGLLLTSCRSGPAVPAPNVVDKPSETEEVANNGGGGDVCQPGPATWNNEDVPTPHATRMTEASDLTFSVWSGGAGVVRQDEVAGEFRNLSLSLYRIRIVEGEPASGPHRAGWWSETSLELVGPSTTHRVEGDALLDLFSPGGFERGATLVVELAAHFPLSETGSYTARWNTPDGTLELPLVVLERADYLRCRLHTDTVYNAWELVDYGHQSADAKFTGLAGEALTDAREEDLRAALRDGRECFIEGSGEATLGAAFAHRVKDYAAFILAKRHGVEIPELREQSAQARDGGIAKLRDALP